MDWKYKYKINKCILLFQLKIKILNMIFKYTVIIINSINLYALIQNKIQYWILNYYKNYFYL